MRHATCTRRLEFDAGHRLVRHESKCRNLHGHRYVVEVTVRAALDSVGRAYDFGEIKRKFGGWIDKHLDHALILHPEDVPTFQFCVQHDLRAIKMPPGDCWEDGEPTAENLARFLAAVADDLLRRRPDGVEVRVTHLRLYETPNCWADWTP